VQERRGEDVSSGKGFTSSQFPQFATKWVGYISAKVKIHPLPEKLTRLSDSETRIAMK
jgi:hypothetical protein